MSRSKVLVLGGACALAALIVGAALLLPSPETPSEPEAETPTARPTSPAAAATPKPSARIDPDEAAARSLFEAASTSSAFRDVWIRYPNTAWGKRAEERFRAMDATSRASADREFEEVRTRAAKLGAAEAVAAWRDYAAKAGPDARVRAEAAALEVENRDRAAYNETVARARERAEKRAYAEAAALFEALANGATEEVAAAAAKSAAELRQAAAEDAAAAAAATREAALKAAREDAAPRALAALRARRYEEALKDLEGPEGAADRALVERARAFWEAFLKGARERSGHEVTLLLGGAKRMFGKLEGPRGDKLAMRLPEGPLDVPMDQLALDQIAAWALGKSPEGAACLDAAMFFFAEGRDDLASTYLATAKEKGADAEAVERTWREGLLRAAAWAAAQPKKKKS